MPKKKINYNYTAGSEFMTIPAELDESGKAKSLGLTDEQYERAFDELSQLLSSRMSIFTDDNEEIGHLYFYQGRFNSPEQLTLDDIQTLEGKKNIIDMAAAGCLFGFPTGQTKLTQINIASVKSYVTENNQKVYKRTIKEDEEVYNEDLDLDEDEPEEPKEKAAEESAPDPKERIEVTFQCNTPTQYIQRDEEKKAYQREYMRRKNEGISTNDLAKPKIIDIEKDETLKVVSPPKEPVKITTWMKIVRWFGFHTYDKDFAKHARYEKQLAKYQALRAHSWDQRMVLDNFASIQSRRDGILSKSDEDKARDKADKQRAYDKAKAEGRNMKNFRYNKSPARLQITEDIRHRMLSERREKADQYTNCERTIRGLEERSRITEATVTDLTGKYAGADAKQKLDAAAELLSKAAELNPATIEGTAQMRAAFMLYDGVNDNELKNSEAYKALGADIKGFRTLDEMLEKGRKAEYSLAEMTVNNEQKPKVEVIDDEVNAAVDRAIDTKTYNLYKDAPEDQRPKDFKVVEEKEEPKPYYSKETVEPLVRDALAGQQLAALMHNANGQKPEIVDIFAKANSMEEAINTTRTAMTGKLRTNALAERSPSEIVSELADSRLLENFASKGKNLHVTYDETLTQRYEYGYEYKPASNEEDRRNQEFRHVVKTSQGEEKRIPVADESKALKEGKDLQEFIDEYGAENAGPSVG